MQIFHGNVKLYCHYFNIKKDCPFKDKCIFLHTESEKCKFGEICERINCMFRHENNVGENDDDIIEIENMIQRMKKILMKMVRMTWKFLMMKWIRIPLTEHL
jgi:hypothetical protein